MKEESCLICGGDSRYYFSKTYPDFPNFPFQGGLTVAYHRCEACGFTISRTHQQMPHQEWAALNTAWHTYFEANVADLLTNQPPYADQALAIQMLARNGLIDLSDTLDYAAGMGTLARFAKKYLGIQMQLHDDYVTSGDPGVTYVPSEQLRRHPFVVNSAMFEHILWREDLDRVNACVSETGVLMIHTVIAERVPKDPNWFNLIPMVHTAFQTNRSMSVLMKQWGYAASVYAPTAKAWFLFKENAPAVRDLDGAIQAINAEIQQEYFYTKPGFVDYWKGFPDP